MIEQPVGVAAIDCLPQQDGWDGQAASDGIRSRGLNVSTIAARQPIALGTIITVGLIEDRSAINMTCVCGGLSRDSADWSATILASRDLPLDPWRQ